MGQSLIAFDTDHIKEYVFGTNKLKEIRGASSLLDYLNRIVMPEWENDQIQTIYAHGGSGLFIVDSELADTFVQYVQRRYKEETGGRASVTAVKYPLPASFQKHSRVEEYTEDLQEHFELLRWQFQLEKQKSRELVALPSHPFLRVCNACGVDYADAQKSLKDLESTDDPDEAIRDPDEGDELYCESCQKKREQDKAVRKLIERYIDDKSFFSRKKAIGKECLWSKLISLLQQSNKYKLLRKTRRPRDFNAFHNFKGSKEYIALIYADANNMGRAIEKIKSIAQLHSFADTIDTAIYKAVSQSIINHLQIDDHLKPNEQRTDDKKNPLFPFDILLLGGDDILMVVPASVALDVALTIANEFRTITKEAFTQLARTESVFSTIEPTLSVGVVLAPVKYPFGLMRELAKSTLDFAKKKGAEARSKAKEENKERIVDDTRINFMIVTGSSSSKFKTIYDKDYYRKYDKSGQEFHATLRPYTPDDLDLLLRAIREGNKLRLGRTKLHQLREAVVQMNLTTSVIDGLALLANWRDKQRSFVARQVYEFGGRYQMQQRNPDELVFPRVTFPWFADSKNKGKDVYRTSLLDFVELYDFISKETEDSGEEN